MKSRVGVVDRSSREAVAGSAEPLCWLWRAEAPMSRDR